MARLTAVFELIDKMSDKMDSIASRGEMAVDTWERMGESSDGAFEKATTAADGIATSINSYSDVAEKAASQTDYWTDAVGNYDKSALEAVYTTEELVAMGLKSADALEAEAEIMAQCDQAAGDLSSAIEDASEIQNEFTAAMEDANIVAEEIAENDKVSAQTKEDLRCATESVTQALEELIAAQNEAQSVMDEYDEVMMNGASSLEDMEAAATKAAEASDNLVAANEKVSNAMEDLSKATDKAEEEAENAEKNGVNAIEGVAGALASAGITATVKEISENVYELADAFSEAESTVVLATGATGNAIDSLTNSMMNAYAASRTGTLDETAAAVGEINTRLGYTGEQLTDTTELFLDFAAVTGGNAATSVRSVTQLMNQWHVPATEMESVLSKLTYAGQASGISVDTLSQNLTSNKAVLDQLGFSLDEATAMFMQFELSGTNATSVMTGLRTALANGSISSLEELYDVFGEISSGAMTAADASEMFGRKAGPAIVNAVNDGTMSLDDMVSSLENADGTLENTAEAAQTLDQKWTQANNNISKAFTTATEPTLDKLSSGLSNVMNGVGDFLNEHPTATKVITALGVGLTVVATGIAAVSFATTVAIPAITAFATAVNAALGPIGWVALGITALVAAGTALAVMLNDSIDPMEELCASSQQQSDELQRLNSEYERTCDIYGETSAEAQIMKDSVDKATDSFESNKMTVGELYDWLEKVHTAHADIVNDYNDTNREIERQESSTINLINRYRELSTEAEKTSSTEHQMSIIIDKLNESYPELGLSIKDVNTELDKMIDSIEAAANADAEQAKYENAVKTYAKLVEEQTDLEKAADRSLTQAAAKANEYLDQNMLVKYWQGVTSTGVAAAFDRASEATEQANYDLQENLKMQQECIDIIDQYESKLSGTADTAATAAEAVTFSIAQVKDEIDELCEQYDKAYEAARSSIDSTIGVFDTMSTECEMTTTQMIEALEEQSKYLTEYTDNLKKAEEYGLDKSLILKLSDGSEESAAYLDTIINKIDELGGSSENAKTFIEQLNTSFGEVEDAKDEFAKTVAEMQTDFSDKMEEMEKTMAETIDNMELDTEAATAAKSTMEAYVKGILDSKGDAQAAAESVKAVVESTLSSTNVSVGKPATPTPASTPASTPTVTESSTEDTAISGYATGTTYSDDVFIAGENGPELIIGHPGSTVFPAGETDRIIDSISPLYNATNENSAVGGAESYEDAGIFVPDYDIKPIERVNAVSEATGVKKVLLEIAGRGNIELKGEKVDKETMLSFLYEYIKPVLTELLMQEMFEEGDGAYET